MVLSSSSILLFLHFQAMSDKFISDATTAFQLGQTVFAKVTNLDEEKRRFLVTLKISEVICPEGDVYTRLINGLQERKAVKELLSSRGVLMCICVCVQRNYPPAHLRHGQIPFLDFFQAELSKFGMFVKT